MLKAATILILTTLPANAACHRYSHWDYPYPQPPCGIGASPLRASLQNSGIAHRAAESKVWYVQIELPTVAQSAEEDQRTPSQIQDFNEHNTLITKYRAELNNQLEVLKLFRDYQQRLRATTGAETGQPSQPEIVQPERK